MDAKWGFNKIMWEKLKPYIKGWRTVSFNILATILPLISVTEWKEVLPDSWLPYYVLIVTIGNVYLRMITNTKLGQYK